MHSLIQAFGVGDVLTGPPKDIQWMPPGKNSITTRTKDGEPVTREIDVTPELAQRVAQLLDDLIEKARKGEGDLPYIDFNHEDREAAGHPKRLYWAGDDMKRGGIRAEVKWTGAGQDSIKGRTFRRFSPEFYVDEHNQVTALGPNIGGLVNRAAFKRIEPIWSRDASPADSSLGKTLSNLAALVSSIAKALEEIRGQIETRESLKAIQARRWVARAVSDGLIPDRADLVNAWCNLYAADPVRAKAAKDCLPAPIKPAIKRRYVGRPSYSNREHENTTM